MINLQPMFEKHKESEITGLAGALTLVSTTIPVKDATALSPAPNTATIFDRVGQAVETIHYTGISGNTLTGVTRGWGNTAAKVWTPWNDENDRPMINLVNAVTSGEHDNIVKNINALNEGKANAEHTHAAVGVVFADGETLQHKHNTGQLGGGVGFWEDF